MALIDKLTAIGDAIREKNGTTELIPLVDMPQAILDIVSGGGAVYESIVYNEDNTITLTDKDGIVHTMECEYTDGKLTSVKYDRKSIALTYDGDLLVKIGKTAVDMANAKTYGIEALDHTVTFTVDGEAYEVVSVKDGNSVNVPATQPNNNGNIVNRWSVNGDEVIFPYTPTTDVIIDGIIPTQEDILYDFYGVSKTEYPYLLIEWHKKGVEGLYTYTPRVYFAHGYSENQYMGLIIEGPYKVGGSDSNYFYESSLPDKSLSTIVNKTMNTVHNVGETVSSNKGFYLDGAGDYYVTNVPPLTSYETKANISYI